jgi:hypothetical protein
MLPCAYKWVPRTPNNCKRRRAEGEGWCITASTLSSLTISHLGLDFFFGGGGGIRFYETFGQQLAQLCSPPLLALIQLHISATSGCKVKVKVTLEQATKAQRGSIGIALLFL